MEKQFDYIVGYYVLKNDTERPKAGFTKLQDAEEYVNMWDTLLMPRGFIYIDAPEGKYIYGEAGWNSNQPRLYPPAEWKQAYIYDAFEDRNIKINTFLPSQRYVLIEKQNSAALQTGVIFKK